VPKIILLIKTYLLIIICLLLTPLNKIHADTFIYKYLGNPILSRSPSGWDSSAVGMASVATNGVNYKMAYSSYNGRWQIGIAESSDGISWTKSISNPISGLLIEGRDSHDPSLIFNGSNYEMWFSSSLGGGSSDFKIYHAVNLSSDIWVTTPTTPVFQASQGWDSGGISTPRVIKIGSMYQMWYAASSPGSSWKIGYATSTDGLNWTPYAGNPVLYPTKSWEFSQMVGPSVIYDGTQYHMWYNTNNSGSPFNVCYATSSNGTTWDKPADKNPVLTNGPAGSFDERGVGTTSPIVHGSDIWLYYSGANAAWVGAIGLASNGPFPTPTPPNTPTPVPTPLTKVVVVPGLGASWNADAMLNCKTGDYAGSWELGDYAKPFYQPLLDSLNSANYESLTFNYDWRREVTPSAELLTSFINNTDPKVNLVGHSLGGLVGRTYLELEKENNKLTGLLTVGSPHQGAVLAYPAWSGGEIQTTDLVQKIALTVLLKRCGMFKSTREIIQQIIPSVQNLLPIFSYLRDAQTMAAKPVDEMLNRNNWLPTDFSSPFWGVTVGTLSGTGFETLKYLLVKEGTKHDAKLGNWTDGKPTNKSETTSEGDGTVLLTSSQLPETASQMVINQTHSGLVNSTEGIDKILGFLGNTTATTQNLNLTEPKSALVIIGYPANFWVMDPQGKTSRGKSGLATIFNPKSGSYKLVLIPSSSSTLIIVAQFLEDGRVFWKEYQHQGFLPKFASFQFDPLNPQENILK